MAQSCFSSFQFNPLVFSSTNPSSSFSESKCLSMPLRSSDVDDPHTFMDLYVSNSEPILLMRSCAYYPKYVFGAFGIIPVLKKKRVATEDFGVMGLRYGSTNLSMGATLMPFAAGDEVPKTAWLVSKVGRLTAGVQYEPQFGKKDREKYKNLENWSCAIGYGLGSGSPLSPSFNFGLELAKNFQVFEKLGPSLYDFLRKNNYRSFPIDLVREIDRQLLECVAFMHDLRLVHTDLKPENILLVSPEYIKVPDYKGSSRSPKNVEVHGELNGYEE